MHPLHSGQDIVWEVQPHLPSASLAQVRMREHTPAPRSAAGQDWKHHRVMEKMQGGSFSLSHPALVEASEPGKEMRRR